MREILSLVRTLFGSDLQAPWGTILTRGLERSMANCYLASYDTIQLLVQWQSLNCRQQIPWLLISFGSYSGLSGGISSRLITPMVPFQEIAQAKDDLRVKGVIVD